MFTVRATARALLDKGGSWGVLPTPVDHLMTAAGLELAPISAFDEGSMRRYLREAGEKAAQFLRGAIEKVMGVFDVQANVVHIDPTLYKDKQTFLKLHETGHNELPHQRGIYKWIQDCARHLDPRTAELFEREANTFASVVLFQDDGFAKVTVDEPFGIKVPMAAAKKFGASLYAAFREYVRKHHKTCAVVVLEPLIQCPTRGPMATVRRIETSPTFKREFGALALPDFLTAFDDLFALVPLEPRRMSRPQSFQLTDLNGARHEFVGEGFRSSYHTLLLIHDVATLDRTISVGGFRSA
jgi:IrrE N-terminal-like domain